MNVNLLRTGYMVARYHSKKYGPKPKQEFKQISLKKYLEHLELDSDKATNGITFTKAQAEKAIEIIINRPFAYHKNLRKRLHDVYRLIDRNIIFYLGQNNTKYANLDTSEIYKLERGRRPSYLIMDGLNGLAQEFQRKEYRSEKDVWMEDDDNFFQTYKSSLKQEQTKLQQERREQEDGYYSNTTV